MEEWRDIKNYEGFYQVSNEGRVRSLDRKVETKNGRRFFCRGRVRKTQDNGRGYLYLVLGKNGSDRHAYVHRLVAETFLENKENKPEVNHKNGTKSDNRVINLEWMTSRENHKHSFDVLGTYPNKRKLTMDDAREIRRMYFEDGTSGMAIAPKYNVCFQTIYHIINNATYKK